MDKEKSTPKQQYHQTNLNKLRQQFCNHQHYLEFLAFLQNQYPPLSKKINLGSMYQIPIQAQGVKILMRYCFWEIEMINLTMHKIGNQGLQHFIKRNASKSEQFYELHQPWRNLGQISLIKNNITSEGFEGIEKLDLSNLKILRASNNQIDSIGIYHFLSCNWPNLVELDLSSNQIRKDGCMLLMKSNWKHFRRLNLNYNLIENEGVHYLSQSDWPELTQINASNNKLDAQAAVYIKNAHWPKLKSLILNKNKIGKTKQKISNFGCFNLCQIQTNSLEKLSIYGNQITLNGIMMILHCQKLVPKCFLELSRNNFRFQDIKQVLKQKNKFCNQFEN